MAYNTLGYNDVGNIILPQIYRIVTGQEYGAGQIPAAEFTNVAQKTLATGTDNVLGAISQVIGATLFDIDAYDAPFKIIEKDASQFGNLTRKIKFYDSETRDDPSLDFTNVVKTGGAIPDQWQFVMPEVLQLNMQGSVSFAKAMSLNFKGLEYAFRSADELGRFWAGVMTEAKNLIELDKEALRRGTTLNLIGGVLAGAELDTPIAPERKVNLLDEYNKMTGSQLTIANVFSPANLPDFAKFAIARIKSYSDALAAKTMLYQTNVVSPTNKYYTQAVPKSRQRLITLSPIIEQLNTRVRSDIFNKDLVELGAHEEIDFWQDPTPGAKTNIDVHATYLKEDGTTATATVEKSSDKSIVLGVLFDERAAFTSTVENQALATPVNAATRHYNIWFHMLNKYVNSFDNKAIVFVIE